MDIADPDSCNYVSPRMWIEQILQEEYPMSIKVSWERRGRGCRQYFPGGTEKWIKS